MPSSGYPSYLLAREGQRNLIKALSGLQIIEEETISQKKKLPKEGEMDTKQQQKLIIIIATKGRNSLMP